MILLPGVIILLITNNSFNFMIPINHSCQPFRIIKLGIHIIWAYKHSFYQSFIWVCNPSTTCFTTGSYLPQSLGSPANKNVRLKL